MRRRLETFGLLCALAGVVAFLGWVYFGTPWAAAHIAWDLVTDWDNDGIMILRVFAVLAACAYISRARGWTK